MSKPSVKFLQGTFQFWHSFIKFFFPSLHEGRVDCKEKVKSSLVVRLKEIYKLCIVIAHQSNFWFRFFFMCVKLFVIRYDTLSCKT